MGFRSERILAWMNPEAYANGKGFQTLQALYAIGSGGILGKAIPSFATSAGCSVKPPTLIHLVAPLAEYCSPGINTIKINTAEPMYASMEKRSQK